MTKKGANSLTKASTLSWSKISATSLAGLPACPKALARPVQLILSLLQIWLGAQSLSLVQAWTTVAMKDATIFVPCTSMSGGGNCRKGLVSTDAETRELADRDSVERETWTMAIANSARGGLLVYQPWTEGS